MQLVPTVGVKFSPFFFFLNLSFPSDILQRSFRVFGGSMQQVLGIQGHDCGHRDPGSLVILLININPPCTGSPQ